MKPLRENFPAIQKEIARAPHTLFCFDYDGTLTPIVASPELALLSQTTKEALDSLNRKPDSTVAIVSGRKLSEIEEMVGLEGLIYVGNHGLEAAGPGTTYLNPVAQAARPFIDKAAALLEKKLAPFPGVRVENKILTLSIHYRQADEEDVPRIKDLVHGVLLEPFLSSEDLKAGSGKKVIEIRPPVEWEKGKIVEWLIGEISVREKTDSLLTVYFGDDRTDEDAFRLLSGRGITVRVGEEKAETLAEYSTRGVDEVSWFLEKLI